MKKIILMGVFVAATASLQAQNKAAIDEAQKIRDAYLNSEEFKTATTPKVIIQTPAVVVAEVPNVPARKEGEGRVKQAPMPISNGLHEGVKIDYPAVPKPSEPSKTPLIGNAVNEK